MWWCLMYNSIVLNINTLGLWNVLNLCNETDKSRDANRIKVSMGSDYRTEICISHDTAIYNYIQLIT